MSTSPTSISAARTGIVTTSVPGGSVSCIDDVITVSARPPPIAGITIPSSATSPMLTMTPTRAPETRLPQTSRGRLFVYGERQWSLLRRLRFQQPRFTRTHSSPNPFTACTVFWLVTRSSRSPKITLPS